MEVLNLVSMELVVVVVALEELAEVQIFLALAQQKCQVYALLLILVVQVVCYLLHFRHPDCLRPHLPMVVSHLPRRNS